MDRFTKNTLFTYQDIILNHLTKIYEARKSTQRKDWTRFSDLLIDKFAIHSGTLFHLLYGVIEHKDSTAEYRKAAFDVFTVNSLIRTILETYSTFNHIFVLPKSDEEKEFRFLVWHLDGLIEKNKFRIQKSDFDLAESIIDNDKRTIDELTKKIFESSFARNLNANQLDKLIEIKESKVKRVNWRFLFKSGDVKLLSIIDLIEFTCPTRGFYNLYRYSSIHTHSGYISVEQFENQRGKIISEQYVDSLTRMVIFVTILLIKDICSIDENAEKVYLKFSQKDKTDFDGINKAIRENSDALKKWKRD